MTIHIWTDGSCNPNPGPGGAAWVILRRDKKSVKGSKGYHLTTNNRMEIQAVINALYTIRAGAEVVVHSDSQYLVNAFNKNWLYHWRMNGWKASGGRPVKNEDLWRSLYRLTSALHVEWVWKRGHVNEWWNTLVDAMAAEAALRPTLRDVNYERSIK